MTRITTTVLIMMVLLNGSATIMEASGLNDDLGVEIRTGVDEKMGEIVNETNGAFDPNINVVESFISLSVAAINVFGLIIEGVFAAPTLMINILGGSSLVETAVTVFMAPLYIIATLEIIAIAIGNPTV